MNEINIKNLRKKKGISQEKLAEMLGVHLRTVQNYEGGGVIPKAKHAILRNMLCEVSADKPPAAPAAAPVAMPEQAPAAAIYKEIVAEQMGTIAALNREIGAAKEENKHILRQNADLMAQNSALTAQNGALQAEVASLKKECGELRSAMAEHSDNDTAVPWVPLQPDTDMLMAAEPSAQYQRQHRPHGGATLTAP
jgi:DNA-binding XRE family transcriptional regulator